MARSWPPGIPSPFPFPCLRFPTREPDPRPAQACFWFSNGCAIGCDECDGSTRGPIPSFTCTLDKCTYTGKPIQFGPKAPICGPKAPAPRAAGSSMNATMCDSMQRTVNTAAECGSADDFFFYSPWRAPGYAPVIDSCVCPPPRARRLPLVPNAAVAVTLASTCVLSCRTAHQQRISPGVPHPSPRSLAPPAAVPLAAASRARASAASARAT